MDEGALVGGDVPATRAAVELNFLRFVRNTFLHTPCTTNQATGCQVPRLPSVHTHTLTASHTATATHTQPHTHTATHSRTHTHTQTTHRMAAQRLAAELAAAVRAGDALNLDFRWDGRRHVHRRIRRSTCGTLAALLPRALRRHHPTARDSRRSCTTACHRRSCRGWAVSKATTAAGAVVVRVVAVEVLLPLLR